MLGVRDGKQLCIYMIVTRAVVDSLSRQCRDTRDFRDCRHTFPACRQNSKAENGQKPWQKSTKTWYLHCILPRLPI